MRRAWYLFVLLLAGAVSTAPAQARVRVNVYLQTPPGGPPSAVVHLGNLLDDPTWKDALQNAYTIRVHWRVQLWRKRFLFDAPSTSIEWDDDILEVPVLNEFTFATHIGERTRSVKFGTLDSLKQQVERDVLIPTPRGLAAGRWYYAVDVSIAAGNDPGGGSDAGGLSELVQRFILGGGPRQTLSQQISAPFSIPPK